MQRVRLSGLMKLELRDGRIIRLCDGGFVRWASELFISSDPTFGMIGGMQSFDEGVGDDVPTFTLTFLPPDTATATEISAPGMQGSRLRLWIAELDAATDAIIGSPDQQFDGFLDQAILRVGLRKMELNVSFVPRGERFFLGSQGNTLAPAFHKSIYPGELGHDNATGLGIGVAWGTESQNGAYSTQVWGIPFGRNEYVQEK